MAIAGMSVRDPSWTVSFPNDLGSSISQETAILISLTSWIFEELIALACLIICYSSFRSWGGGRTYNRVEFFSQFPSFHIIP